MAERTKSNIGLLYHLQFLSSILRGSATPGQDEIENASVFTSAAQRVKV